MANRRMTSLDVIDTDAFLEMPVSSQLLYFHLNARADDDGFVSNPRKVARSVGAADDDLKILVGKKFLISFEDGVVIIKHWRINNFIRKDRYQETKYLDHKQVLFIRGNGAYTLSEDNRAVPVPLGHFTNEEVNQRLTSGQPSIGKYSIDNNSTSVATAPPVYTLEDENAKPPKQSTAKYPHSKEVFSWFPRPQKSWILNTTELKHAEFLWERGEKRVKAVLAFVEDQKDNPDFLYTVIKPSDLERKWEDIRNWKVKQGL